MHLYFDKKIKNYEKCNRIKEFRQLLDNLQINLHNDARNGKIGDME